MGKSVDQILAENLSRLMTMPGATLSSNIAVEKKSGVGQSTIDRVRKSQPGLSIAKLEMIARAFSLEAWQLIAPNLGAEAAKSDSPEPAPWPFKTIEPRTYDMLNADDKARIEERVLILSEPREDRPAKKKGTAK